MIKAADILAASILVVDDCGGGQERPLIPLPNPTGRLPLLRDLGNQGHWQSNNPVVSAFCTSNAQRAATQVNVFDLQVQGLSHP